MPDADDGQVGLFIDFENLVRGLDDRRQGGSDDLDPEVLFELAEEHGQVVLANAYADWRMGDVNRFQTDLYRLGVDLIHVFGKRRGRTMKNAVDVKMGVDAVETLFALSHVHTFVIVSGDRDFIHVVKTLRRHGKTVIGVSPAGSASKDFASLCDRFVRYGALVKTYQYGPQGQNGSGAEEPAAGGPALSDVRRALRKVLEARPGGVKGAQIKPKLKRELSVPVFDESQYGFSRFKDFLHELSDVAQVQDGDGDIVVFSANLDLDATNAGRNDMADRWIGLAGLGKYRYERSAERRRCVLRLFHRVMEQEGEHFSQDEIFERLLDEEDSCEVSFSRTVLSRYWAMLWQNRAFQQRAGNEDLRLRERPMRLAPHITGADDLVETYEQSVAYKLVEASEAKEVDAPTPEALTQVLGLANEDGEAGAGEAAPDAYCTGLLQQARHALADQKSSAPA